MSELKFLKNMHTTLQESLPRITTALETLSKIYVPPSYQSEKEDEMVHLPPVGGGKTAISKEYCEKNNLPYTDFPLSSADIPEEESYPQRYKRLYGKYMKHSITSLTQDETIDLINAMSQEINDLNKE